MLAVLGAIQLHFASSNWHFWIPNLVSERVVIGCFISVKPSDFRTNSSNEMEKLPQALALINT